jgi:splicing factor 3A subunit 3
MNDGIFVPNAKLEEYHPDEEEMNEMVQFSGEECFGKYVDLVSFHERYVNMKQFPRIDYIKFLQVFAQFDTIEESKKDTCYQKFYQDVLDYLISFHERVNPYFSMAELNRRIEEQFAKESNDSTNKLFCIPCQKLFAKETVLKAHLASKKHAKRVKALEPSLNVGQNAESKQSMALVEYKIKVMAKLLADRIEATRHHLEAIQTRTFAEIEAERNQLSEEELEDEEDSEEEEEDMIYNPKNVPLGWDGKPIPYWLYKLHGLNLEYKCEICGDYSYWGPRAFERHFSEWRHVNGLKSLKITNSVHYKHVTKIEDALALQKRLENDHKNVGWKPEEDEEFEDEEGNVFKKKTFDDLKRQGLL